MGGFNDSHSDMTVAVKHGFISCVCGQQMLLLTSPDTRVSEAEGTAGTCKAEARANAEMTHVQVGQNHLSWIISINK